MTNNNTISSQITIEQLQKTWNEILSMPQLECSYTTKCMLHKRIPDVDFLLENDKLDPRIILERTNGKVTRVMIVEPDGSFLIFDMNAFDKLTSEYLPEVALRRWKNEGLCNLFLESLKGTNF